MDPKFNAKQTITFMVSLSVCAALVLSVLSSVLKPAQQRALELDRSQEMLKSIQVLNHQGYFQIREQDALVPAKYVGQGRLVASEHVVYPSEHEVLEVVAARIFPRFVNAQGEVKTDQELGIDLREYLEKFKSSGYSSQEWRLLYEVLPNPPEHTSAKTRDAHPIAYVIPVNGFGLWDAIFGYLAIAPDGETVLGISWYEQKETPGLGANIADWDWQKQFVGKKIFQPSADGAIDPKTSPVGIQVVRGKVREVYGEGPKSESAVDGMAGATITGNGVTEAYQKVLSGYRNFFVQLHQQG